MKKQSPLRRKISLLILMLLFFSPAFLQGCDGLMGSNESETEDFYTDGPIREEAPVSSKSDKFRFPRLLDQARTISKTAGKNGASDNVHLYLAFNMYEANGVTPRILNKYDVTRRILNQYGVTRRVLNKYDVTRRILNQYGITRRILNQYDVTRRILNQYGLVTRYGGVITEAMLAEFNLTPAQLLEAGVSQADIADYNTLSELVNEYGLTAELFEEEMENFVSKIRLKIRIKEARPGITVAMESALLDVFLEEISDDPDILFIEPDVQIDMGDLLIRDGLKHENQMIPWNTARVGGVFTNFESNSEVHVFLLDSGIHDYDMNIVEEKDFTMLFVNREEDTWEDTGYIDMEVFDPGENGNPADESGHGTHVAGIIGAQDNDKGIKGMAPGAKIHSLKVLTDEGSTDITTVIAAIDYVTDWKQRHPLTPVVMNMSLGMDLGSTAYNVLDEAVQNATQFGVSVVVSAGNDGADASTYSPAHVVEAITVGSYNQDGAFSSFSNHGPSVDLLAPGEMVISLTHLEDEADEHENVLMSGTSNATPHVTAAAALYLHQHPDATPQTVKQALVNHAQASIENAPQGTTNKSVYVSGFADDGNTKDFSYTKAEWNSDNHKLKLEGNGPRLDTVTLKSDATGEELGTVTIAEDGKWKLELENPSRIPCAVTASYNGYQHAATHESKAVLNAPGSCEGPFHFTKVEWKESDDELKIEGKGPFGLEVVFTSVTTGETITMLTTDNHGNFKYEEKNLSIRPCIVRASFGENETMDFIVTNPPGVCAGTNLPVVITKAEYDDSKHKLKVEGTATPGVVVHFSSVVSGTEFASEEADNKGKFKIDMADPAVLPCIVRVTSDEGFAEEMNVVKKGTSTAPSNCERSLEVETVKWSENNQELELKGRGLVNRMVTFANARTGNIFHTAMIGADGKFDEKLGGLPAIPCAVIVESQEAALKSFTLNVEDKAFNCDVDLTFYTLRWFNIPNVLSMGGGATADTDVRLVNPDNGVEITTVRTGMDGVWRADLNLSESGNIPPCSVRATAENGDVIENAMTSASCNAGFTYTHVEEEIEQNAHSFITMTKSEWSASSNRLRVEGTGYVLSPVTIVNPVTGEVLGQTMTDDDEKWNLDIYNPASAPCSVEAELDGRQTMLGVKNAPLYCDGNAYVELTKAEWKSNELKIEGEAWTGTGATGVPVTFTNASTGAYVGSATTEDDGEWSVELTGVNPIPCAITAALDGATMDMVVDKAPASCSN